MNTYLCYKVTGIANEESIRQDVKCVVPSPKDWFTNNGGG